MTPIKRKRGRPARSHAAPVDPTPTTLAPADMGAEGLADLKTAARFLGGICVRTVEREIARGKLPLKRVGDRKMIPWAALRAYVADTD